MPWTGPASCALRSAPLAKVASAVQPPHLPAGAGGFLSAFGFEFRAPAPGHGRRPHRVHRQAQRFQQAPDLDAY